MPKVDFGRQLWLPKIPDSFIKGVGGSLYWFRVDPRGEGLIQKYTLLIRMFYIWKLANLDKTCRLPPKNKLDGTLRSMAVKITQMAFF